MNEIYELIKKNNNILVLTHESPDGDAIGSAMAVYHMLKDINKTVDIVIPEMPETFLFMDDIDKISTQSDKEYDLTIVVDCATKETRSRLSVSILFTRLSSRLKADSKVSFCC